MSPQDPAFGSISSLNGIDLQTFAAAGQLPAQSLATLQGRPTAKAGMPMSFVDQRNLFSFENPRLRFGDGQQQQVNNNKPVNLLHGIPTNMEPKQLANLHQSSQSIGGLNMRGNSSNAPSNHLLVQMNQSQPRGQLLGENTNSQVPGLPSSMGQPSIANGIPNGVLGRNGIAESGSRGAPYNPVPQTSSMLSFPVNQNTEMPGSSFPLGSTPGISSITTKGSFQEEVTSGIKGSTGLVPSYDIFNELHQQKSHDWGLQNVGMRFDASPHLNPLRGNIDVSPSILVSQVFPSSQQTGQSGDTNPIGKALFSLGEGMAQGNLQNIGQHLNTLVDNSVRVKTERVTDPGSQTNLFTDHYGQEDLMSALLKQVDPSSLALHLN